MGLEVHFLQTKKQLTYYKPIYFNGENEREWHQFTAAVKKKYRTGNAQGELHAWQVGHSFVNLNMRNQQSQRQPIFMP